MPEQSDREAFNTFAGQYRENLIRGTAQAYGEKASDAVTLSPEDELTEWERPTSPPALMVLKAGGSMEDAQRANAMWAAHLQSMAAEAKTAGATVEQLQQAGLTDEQIFQQCRKSAYELGRANGKGSPRGMVEYHARMAKRAAERARPQMSYQTVAGEEGA